MQIKKKRVQHQKKKGKRKGRTPKRKARGKVKSVMTFKCWLFRCLLTFIDV